MADIDTISIFLTQNIGDIDIKSFTAALFGLLIYFIIASKVVNDVDVIP